MKNSEEFQHHICIISKFACCGSYMKTNVAFTLASGIDVGQGINVGPGKFGKRINIGP